MNILGNTTNYTKTISEGSNLLTTKPKTGQLSNQDLFIQSVAILLKKITENTSGTQITTKKRPAESQLEPELATHKKQKIDGPTFVSQEIATDNYFKLNEKHFVHIVDAKKQPNKDEIIKRINQIGSENNLIVYLNDKEWEKQEIFIAIDNNKKVVGFLIGKNREADFYVHRLAVDKTNETGKINFAEEKVGTRLMFSALQKTKELGKKQLYLEYDPGSSCSWMEEAAQEKYINACRRRDLFYQRFERFNVSISYNDQLYWDSDPKYGYEKTRKIYFNIEKFNLEESLKTLFAKGIGSRSH